MAADPGPKGRGRGGIGRGRGIPNKNKKLKGKNWGRGRGRGGDQGGDCMKEVSSRDNYRQAYGQLWLTNIE